MLDSLVLQAKTFYNEKRAEMLANLFEKLKLVRKDIFGFEIFSPKEEDRDPSDSFVIYTLLDILTCGLTYMNIEVYITQIIK